MGSQDAAETNIQFYPLIRKSTLFKACSGKKKRERFIGYLLNEDVKKKWVVIKSVVFSSGSPLHSKIKPVHPKGNQP